MGKRGRRNAARAEVKNLRLEDSFGCTAMRVYADSSFLVRMASLEPGCEEARAVFEALARPLLPFLYIHRLETLNAMRLRAFHAARSGSPKERVEAKRLREASLGRVARWEGRGWLVEKVIDWEAAMKFACGLSERNTERTGSRSLDLLHISCAIQLRAEIFLTTDRIQAEVARAEEFDVPDIDP